MTGAEGNLAARYPTALVVLVAWISLALLFRLGPEVLDVAATSLRKWPRIVRACRLLGTGLRSIERLIWLTWFLALVGYGCVALMGTFMDTFERAGSVTAVVMVLSLGFVACAAGFLFLRSSGRL